MNHVFRVIFNRALGVCQVVAEIASAQGKGRSAGHGGKRTLHVLALLPLSVWASLASAASPAATSATDGLRGGASTQAPRVAATTLPSGGTVSAGSGSITQGSAAMTITQQSQNLAINWQSFDIGRDASVTFLQPNGSAIALNRVLGTEGSQILGQLKGNGQVWVINPNGVLFGSSAQVSVGGLVASTLGLSDADFMDGKRTFTGSGGRVVNQGRIDAGHVALLGETVSNEGVIAARLGTAALAAGNTVTLDFAGDHLLNVQVDEGALHALAENRGLIQADGGIVLMTARAKDSLLNTAVNNSGMIRARSVENRDGRILLLGDMDSGTANIAGTLDASAPDGGNGGFIETSAARVKVANGANITTMAANGQSGTWLVDPTDFTVSSGTAAKTSSGIGATTLQNILRSTGVTLTASGDVNVNANVMWSGNTTLGLSAGNSVNVNADITATGSGAGLAVNYGTGNFYINGSVNLPITGSLSINNQSYTLVNNVTGLGTGHYALVSDITMPVTAVQDDFGGTLEGLGHSIKVDILGDNDDNRNVGLFGQLLPGSVVRNLGVDGNVTGLEYVGLLAGKNMGSVINAHSSGSVIAVTRYGGGLLGQNGSDATAGTVLGSSSSAAVVRLGASYLGGLVGFQENGSTIIDSSATGTVSGGSYLGGLVGSSYGKIVGGEASGNVTSNDGNAGGLVGSNGGDITKSHASGNVSATGNSGSNVGGLVGYNNNTISYSYATGDASSGSNSMYIGGLVGRSESGSISNAYATGAATGATWVGGLVGGDAAGYVEYVWASGKVTGNTGETGGLFGLISQHNGIRSAFWDKGTTGQNAVYGSINGTDRPGDTYYGLTTTEAFTASNYHPGAIGLDDANWFMIDGSSRPMLRAFLNSADSGGVTAVSNLYQLQGMAANLSGKYVLTQDIDAVATASSNAADVWGGKGFTPVGRDSDAFTGTFDGQDHTISGLSINRPTQEYIGLFGYTQNATLNNVGLLDASIIGGGSVGTLVGWADHTTIRNSYVEDGAVRAITYVGGLAGVLINDSLISDSYASVDVTSTTNGDGFAGGLLGILSYTSSITNSYATGDVFANIYSAGENRAGGLIGAQSDGTISNSYATGMVSGSNTLGGLVGIQFGGTISTSYATGTVTGTYASNLGGLVGKNSGGTSSNSFYATTDASGIAINAGAGFNTNGTAKTLAQLKQASTFSSWSLSGVGGDGTTWRIYDGYTTPLLRSFLTPLAIGVTPDYDGTSKSLTNIASVTVSSVPIGDMHIHGSGTPTISGGTTLTLSSTKAGEYTATSDATISGGSGLWSDQQGYDIAFSSVATRTISTPGSAAGDIQLPGSLQWGSGTLVINTNGNLTTGSSGLLTTAINGDVFRLVNGTWSQNAATLAGFSVNDFQLAGGSFLRVTGGNGGSASPWQLVDVYGLQGMLGFLGDNFALVDDIDAGRTSHWNCDAGSVTCAGFVPVGTSAMAFSGSFDGQGHTIDGLAINRAAQDYVGLFGYADGALGNIVLTHGSVSGKDYVGALAGYTGTSAIVEDSQTGVTVNGSNRVGGLVGEAHAAISGSQVSGNITGAGDYVGGLVGAADAAITDSHVTGTVHGMDYTGGLVGWTNALLQRGHVSGAVTGRYYVGGLVGFSSGGTTKLSYATGAVRGESGIGGLAGRNTGSITQSYATGNVTDTNGLQSNAGGLVGENENGSIAQSYATGNVSGGSIVGGLVAYNSAGSITESYAAGSVSSGGTHGGLVGLSTSVGSSITNSFFATTDLAGNDINSGGSGIGIGKTYAQLQQLSTFTDAGWDISDVGGDGTAWRIYEGQTAPLLRGFMTGVTVNVDSAITGKIYDGQTVSGTVGGYTTSAPVDTSQIGGALGYTTDSGNAGDYSIGNGKLRLGGLYSGQQGYDISYGGTASVTIGKAALTVTANNVNKTYDGNAWTGGNGVSYAGFVNGEDASVLGGALNWGGSSQGAANAGNYIISASGLSSGNYFINYINGTLVIDPRALAIAVTLTGLVKKTYDGSTVAMLDASNFLVSGWVGSDGATIAATQGRYDNANAGAGKTVTVDLTLADYLAQGGTNLANYVLPTQASGNVGVIDKAAATVTANSATVTYNGQTQGVNGYTVTGLVNGEDENVLDSLIEAGGSGRNAGSHAHVISGSDNNYDLTFVDGALVIDKALLTVSTSDVIKTYDGKTSAVGNAIILGGQLYGSDAISGGEFTYTDKNAGSNKTITVDGVIVNDDNSGNNYDVSYVANTTSAIVRKALSINGGFDAEDKLHDGLVDARIIRNALALNGVVSGDAVTANWKAVFADAAKGMNKRVTLQGTSLVGSDSSNYLIDLDGAPTAIASIVGTPVGAGSLRYAGATRSAKVDDGRRASHASAVPAIAIQQCGLNLPTQLATDCHQ